MKMYGNLRWVVGGDDAWMQDDGATALIAASANGHAEVVGALLASGANVNQVTTVSIFWRGGHGEKRDNVCVCACVRVCVCACVRVFLGSLVERGSFK